MEIIYKKLKELKPYKNNPRKNDEAVDYVAESIKQLEKAQRLSMKINHQRTMPTQR